ncbi:hypothetical protein ATDW_36870 (plasmid) [Asticcacaulis sp. DW145]|uniref:hypothetical protein n=1 Tax=Asticcacaulis sp. DW145 TaxID=3095608 RepID=UPI00308627C4|nr:hypothetical protein ATDW_36870 [Asticcacaulis sp. DW145]
MNAIAPFVSTDGDFDFEFPDCILTHVFSMATADEVDVAIETLLAVRNAGAKLAGMRVFRIGAQLHHKVRVRGIRTRDAHQLADRLAAIPGVSNTTVEHVVSHQSQISSA